MFISPHKAYKSLIDDLRAQTSSDALEQPSEYDLLELHAFSETMYVCASVRGDNVAAVNFYVSDGDGNEVDMPELSPVFSKQSNWKEVLWKTEVSLCYTGGALVIPTPNILGQFTPYRDNLRWLNPRLWNRQTSPTNGLEGFRVSTTYGLDARFYKPHEAIYFVRGIDFRDDYDAIAPAEVAYRAGRSQGEKWETINSFLMNRAIPSTIIQAAPPAARLMDEGGLRAVISRLFKGSRNAGRTLVSPERLEAVTVARDMASVVGDSSVLSAEQRSAISDAFQVPQELINFSGATYANAREAKNWFAENWLIPRVEWYADVLSRFFTRWYGKPVLIAADISSIQQTIDKTDIVSQQVASGIRDLYSAQIEIGLDADERLRDMYLFNGLPVHVSKLPELSSALTPAPTLPAFSFPAIEAAPDVQTPAAPTINPALVVDANKADGSITSGGLVLSLANNPDLIMLQNQARKFVTAPCEWTPADEFHITLVYMPGITDEQTDDVLAALENVTMPELSVGVGSLRVFKNPGQSAIHFRILRNEALLAFQRQLVEAITGAGVPVSSYSLPDNFIPHITMAYSSEAVEGVAFRASRIKLTPTALEFAVSDDVLWTSEDAALNGEPDEEAADEELKTWRKFAAKHGAVKAQRFACRHLDARIQDAIRGRLAMVDDAQDKAAIKAAFDDEKPDEDKEADSFAELVSIWQVIGLTKLVEQVEAIGDNDQSDDAEPEA